MKDLIQGAIKASLLVLLCTAGNALAGDGAETIDTGTTAWMLTSTALVLLMIPGLAMFYGGLVRTKNVLGTMMHSFASMAIIGVIWMVCGYSMCFGENVLGGWFGWNPDYFLLSGIDESITGGIPEYVFAMFQCMFAMITPALIAGAFAERVKFRGYCIFIALWSIFVYNPLCHWVWAGDGFLYQKGAIDFAGGTVIHISAGAAALVAALYLGARRGYPKTAMRPNNLVMTLIGAGLLWFGWFGFNAGSSAASDLSTGQAFAVTQIAAAAGALSWMILEGILHKKVTALGFVSGVLAGLVAITPAAGAVQPLGALILGLISSVLCYLAIEMKNKLGYDDSLDVFGIHGMAGIWGAIGLVFFLRPGTTDNTLLGQLWVQVEGCLVSLIYSGVVTFILLIIVEKLFGFRMKSEDEMAGIDHSEHSERGYGMLNLNS
ncbi:MAG: ammonia channel protein [Kiritimatiellaceae bacterium]|nr:ammonia channel protein [Kiritimatiellaceae bacterium]